MLIKTRILATLVAVGLGAAAGAGMPEPVQQHNSNAVWFENWIGLSNAQMTVRLPNGKIETVSATSGTPVYRLSGDKVMDGVYRYEITAASDEVIEIVNPIDNGRGENAKKQQNKPFYMSGQFLVSRNVIITPADIKEE